MTVSYRISRAAPHDVRSDVLRLWRGSLPVEGDGGDRFRWTYDEAPERPRELYMLAADDGARPQLVGTAGVQIRPFSAFGRELRGAISCNLAVDPLHRTVLPALRLVRDIQRVTRAEFDLTCSFPNEQARALYARAGYHELGAMVRYVAILRHARYVARIVHRPGIARVLASALDVVRGLRCARAARRFDQELRLEWLDDADERFDTLWHAACRERVLLATRDAAWLRWRYVRHPGCRCELVALVDRRASGTLRGYAVIEPDEDDAREIHVRDVLARPRDLDAMFALLVDALHARGATKLAFCYLGSRDVVDVLTSHGFQVRGSKRHVYVDAGQRLSETERARLRDRESWYLTDFDKDN